MPNPIGRALRGRRAGHNQLSWNRPELDAPESFTLTSAAFQDGAPIPARYRGRLFAPNVSPPLMWTEPPLGTAELALLIEDPDVPTRHPGIHGITIAIPADVRELDENALRQPSPQAGLRHGHGALGRRGWLGPAPVPSHGPHDYVFQLFALNEPLTLSGDRFRLADVVTAMSGHVIARARLTGTYEIA